MSSNIDHPANGTAARAGRSWHGVGRSASPGLIVSLMPDTHPSMTGRSSQPVPILLGTIPSLRFATPAGLRDLAAASVHEAAVEGDVIVRQGDSSDDVFFVLKGVFEVLISHFGNSPDFIRVLRAGDSFGELGVLYDVPRTATVQCTNAGEVLRIPGPAFLDALETGC